MRHFVFAALVLIYAISAKAELFFEPYLGFGSGSMETSTTTGSSTTATKFSGDASIGPAVGGKVGFFYDYLYLALDMQYSLFSVEGLSTNSTYSLTRTGLGIGFDINLPLRIYYSLDTSVTLKSPNATIETSGSRFSIGYYLDLNAILSLVFATASGSSTTATGAVDASLNSVMLTFSFPMEYLYPEASWKERTR